MERQNLITDYNDAEQLIKVKELMQQYPEEVQKQLPCYNVSKQINGETINNELNIHNSKQKRYINSISKRKTSFANNLNIKNNLSQKNSSVQYQRVASTLNEDKISTEELLEREITEIKKNQNSQIQTMNQLVSKLEELIKKTKSQQKSILNKERQTVEQLQKQLKNLQKKHKNLSEEYFDGRRSLKTGHEILRKESQQLINKNKILEDKISREIKFYEKQNKAKQTLIIKKSEDFQENYKAKMRAKEKNLQALKENYEKMQTVCIQKVNKLEKALKRAKVKLSEAEQRRQFLISELRDQLHNLETSVLEQKNQRQQRQLKIKIKIQKEKKRNEQLKDKQEKEQAQFQKHRLIDEAYKKTLKKSKSKDKSKSRAKKIAVAERNTTRKDIYGKKGQQSEDDESMQIDDLENIKKQIGQLQNRIASDTR